MGNAVWGHGYHQGFADGAKQGGVLGVAGTIAVGVVVAGVAFGYRELKARSFAKRDQELAAEGSNPVAEESAGDEQEASEGTTNE
ncbi:hypothetical protein ACWCO3_34580 [Micromonospora sp. NPDC002411]